MKLFYIIIFLILSNINISIADTYNKNRVLSRDLTPIPTNINPDVNLKINIENKKDSYEVEEYMSFHVTADKDGYITLWDIGTSGYITRIFPNEHSNRDLYVKAGSKYSLGGDATNFTFKVTGRPGNNGVYAIWSERIEDQPSSSQFESSLSMSRDMIPFERKKKKSWATDNIKFEILGTDNNNEEGLFSSYQFDHSGKVYILAMGADTAGLQRANDDAELFSKKISDMFSSSQLSTDLKTNVTRDEFIESLEELSEVVTPQDLVIIYFSGHGALVKDDNNDENSVKGNTGNDAVFVTHGAEREGLTTDVIVRDDEFASLVNNINTNNIISFIDACHAGGMQRDLLSNRIKYFPWGYKDLSLAPLTILDGNPDPLPIIDNAKGLVLAAAEERDNAIELFNGGYFTYIFLEELHKAKEDSNLFSIFNNTLTIVEKDTNAFQTPIAVGDNNIAKKLKLIKKEAHYE